MGQKCSGKIGVRSAPFQIPYTSFASAIDLTEAVTQAKCATSGLYVVVTTSAKVLQWKDCTGTTRSATLPVGAHDLPFAATELGTSTTADLVVAYWHSNGGT